VLSSIDTWESDDPDPSAVCAQLPSTRAPRTSA
jgi:hypothetical protein